MKPVLFRIGTFPIRSWGVLVALGFLVGLFFVRKRAEEKGLSSDIVYDLAIYILIAGIIGGRLVSVLFDLTYYVKNPLQIIMLQSGGMAIHGALIGGFLATWYFAKKHDLSLLSLGDIIAPAVLIGQGIGRIGCFLNGDDYGIITKMPWAVKFPGLVGMRHPTQLYEMALDFIAFVFLWVFRDKFKSNGEMLFTAVIAYSVIRFFVEIFRADMGILIWKLTWGEGVSLLAIIVSIIGLIIIRKNNSDLKPPD